MVARVVHAHHPSTGETKAGRLCSLTGTPQGAECLELLSFVPLAWTFPGGSSQTALPDTLICPLPS